MASNEGCGPQLAAQPFVDTDGNGAGTTTFAAHSTACLKPYNTALTRPCTDQCAVVAARGVAGQPPGRTVMQFR